jgi:uncharacterized protein
LRIGVVSDSHGNLFMLDRALSMMKDADMFIHLGDHCFDMDKIAEKYNKPYETVTGNNECVSSPEYEKTLVLGGKRIFITHGHNHSVYYGVDRLYYKGLEEDADIVLFGHTHIQSLNREGNIIILNPGSVSRPRDSMPGCAVITIDGKGEIDVELLRIEY